jgi:DNA-binding transcriptional regulator YdaS (Cro superfamily)
VQQLSTEVDMATKTSRTRGRPIVTRADPGLTAAIQKAGSVSALAALIGVSMQAASKWTNVPAARVEAIAAALGISRHKLRPDLYKPNGRKVVAA